MKHLLLLSAAIFALPAGASAAEADAAEAGDSILVIGKSHGYVALESTTATKTDTPLIDVPQTINVITREQLDDQAQHSMADVLRYVPGTTVGQGEGNRDQITLRGQNTTADFFIDGVRDDVQYFRNLYNIERVEVLKGSSALIFGRGGGGGVINRVQKAPSADRLFGSVSGSVNTFGNWDVAADVNLPISASGALRVNGFYENLDNFRDAFGGERYAVNPNIAFDLGGGWKAGLSYEYVHDDRVNDRGIPSLACVQPCTPGPLTGQRDTFFGVEDVNRTAVDAHIVKARVDGQLAENVLWSTTLLYGDYDKYYTNVYADGAATSPTSTVKLAGYYDPTKRENFIAQTNLVWDVALGGVTNKVLLGLEYGEQKSFNQRRTAVLSNSTFDLSARIYPTVTFPTLNRNTASKVKTFSAYAQDQIGIGEHVELVVGVRFDRFDIEGTDFAVTPARPFARVDEKVSPRVGLIIKPRENISIYGSYSQSFLPRSGDQFLSMTVAQESLEPEKFTNYEIGAKWNIRPDLSATVALFQLDRDNAVITDPANSANTIIIDTRTQGVEAALTGQITRDWQISAGYTHQIAKARGNDYWRLGQVPRHQFALWNRYNFNRWVGAGVGVIHQSSQFAALRTLPTTTLLPAFTRVDAAMFFNASERLQFQINVENVLDETYFGSAHNNNNISPGAPINARFTARMRF
ncbi:MAG: TonB-dependent siderophore receptor [Pseudomonadota bacterium]